MLAWFADSPIEYWVRLRPLWEFLHSNTGILCQPDLHTHTLSIGPFFGHSDNSYIPIFHSMSAWSSPSHIEYRLALRPLRDFLHSNINLGHPEISCIPIFDCMSAWSTQFPYSGYVRPRISFRLTAEVLSSNIQFLICYYASTTLLHSAWVDRSCDLIFSSQCWYSSTLLYLSA